MSDDIEVVVLSLDEMAERQQLSTWDVEQMAWDDWLDQDDAYRRAMDGDY